MHFVDAPDLLGQSRPPVNPETPRLNGGTRQL